MHVAGKKVAKARDKAEDEKACPKNDDQRDGIFEILMQVDFHTVQCDTYCDSDLSWGCRFCRLHALTLYSKLVGIGLSGIFFFLSNYLGLYIAKEREILWLLVA